MVQPLSQVYVGTINDNNSKMLYANTGYGYQIKNSFLSAIYNTNSHNQSGNKIDTSLSNESG